MPTKRKDGRYQSSMTITNPITGEKEKKYIYGYTLEEIEFEKNRIKQASLDSFFRVTTFHSWCEEWLGIKKDEDKLSETTLESYKLCLNRHIYPHIPENTKLKDVAIFHIRNILRNIKGDRTKEYTYTILNGIFRQAVTEQLISVNPCSFIKKPKVKAKPAEIIEPEAYNAIMDMVKGTQFEYLLTFAWDTGMRRGEIAAVRWEDIDIGEGMLHVKKARKITDRGEIEGNPKSGSGIRSLPLSPSAIENLKAWRKILRKRLFERGLPWKESGYVFRRERNYTDPLPLRTITNTFANIVKKLNLPKRTCFHSLRHTHATLLAESDLSAKKIQVRLGHASAAFTLNKYTHNSARMQDGVVDALERAKNIYKSPSKQA